MRLQPHSGTGWYINIFLSCVQHCRLQWVLDVATFLKRRLIIKTSVFWTFSASQHLVTSDQTEFHDLAFFLHHFGQRKLDEDGDESEEGDAAHDGGGDDPVDEAWLHSVGLLNRSDKMALTEHSLSKNLLRTRVRSNDANNFAFY